jgi:hypothetical protein
MANPAFAGRTQRACFLGAFISTNEPRSPASPSLPLWILPLAAPSLGSLQLPDSCCLCDVRRGE